MADIHSWARRRRGSEAAPLSVHVGGDAASCPSPGLPWWVWASIGGVGTYLALRHDAARVVAIEEEERDRLDEENERRRTREAQDREHARVMREMDPSLAREIVSAPPLDFEDAFEIHAGDAEAAARAIEHARAEREKAREVLA